MMAGKGKQNKLDDACQDLGEEVFGEEAAAPPAKPKGPNKRPWLAWNGDSRMPRAEGRVEVVRCTYLDQMKAGQYGTQTPADPKYLQRVAPGLSA